MKRKILTLLALCAMAVSCTQEGDTGKNNGGDPGGDSGDPTGTPGVVEHLDIADAAYLYTTSSASGASRAGGGDTSAHLFKVLANGTSEEVEIVDGNGDPIIVDEIYVENITDDLVRFGYTRGSVTRADDAFEHSEYFARKSDGAVFEVPEMLYRHNAPLEEAIYIQTDGTQTIYCAGYNAESKPNAIYKIAPSNDGLSATIIVDDVLADYFPTTPFAVDKLGYIIYQNTWENTYCIKPNGEKFLVKNFAIGELIPMPNETEEGFLYNLYNMTYANDPYIAPGPFHVVAIDASENRVEIKPLMEKYEGGLIELDWFEGDAEVSYSFDGHVVVLPDMIVLSGDMNCTLDNQALLPDYSDTFTAIVKSTTDITTYEDTAIPERTSLTPLSDGIYWIDGNSAYKFDCETGEITTAGEYTPKPGWEYSEFSFAEGLIMFYAIDRVNEKRYRCEIRNGAYSETDITEDEESLPTIINFIRVN